MKEGKIVSKVVYAVITSEWLTEEAKHTREAFRVEAARVAGDWTLGKAFESPKRAVLDSCMAAIFIKIKKHYFLPIRLFEINFATI